MPATVTCDRCAATIESDRTLLRVETGPLRTRREAIDLCAECVKALVAWLRTGDDR
jgi:hypothetical protein